MSSPPAQTQSPPIENFLATVLGWTSKVMHLMHATSLAHDKPTELLIIRHHKVQWHQLIGI